MAEMPHAAIGGPVPGQTHLPSEELVLACAVGALDPASDLIVRTQALMRPALVQALETLEAFGGALIETVEPAAMAPVSLERTLARLDEPPEAERPAVSDRRRADPELLALPEPLRGLALGAHRLGGWRYRGLGLRTLPLNIAGARPGLAQVLRIEAGAAVPRHGHTGDELTLVLRGAFSDGVAAYGPGDLALARPGLIHRPQAAPGEACLCLTVTEAPLQWLGPLGWLQRRLAASQT